MSMPIDFTPSSGLEVAKERKKETKEIFFKTNLSFLEEHNGFRPATQSLFIGLPGGGKSTQARTLLLDTYKNKKKNEKAGIWYSEETQKDFEIHFSETPLGETFFSKKEVNFYSEPDSFEDPSKDFKKLEAMFEQSSIVFFDNLTTSSFYDGQPYQTQVKFVKALKNLVKKYEKPLIVFAHTDGKTKEGAKSLIEMNDINGPKTIVKLSEFVYSLQQFHVGSSVHSTLRILKFRGQEVKSKIFSLTYDPKFMTYSDATRITFTDFKNIFEMRNRL